MMANGELVFDNWSKRQNKIDDWRIIYFADDSYYESIEALKPCKYCGTKNYDKDNTCHTCGAPK
jgi:hypothetical protein